MNPREIAQAMYEDFLMKHPELGEEVLQRIRAVATAYLTTMNVTCEEEQKKAQFGLILFLRLKLGVYGTLSGPMAMVARDLEACYSSTLLDAYTPEELDEMIERMWSDVRQRMP